ncbi:MAG: phenylacetate-CoA ligase [Actinomycetota bacterium]|jgi:phenylacetate-CoA ligase|nr:phenylacetate-CoA ligase [Actinomycetota bacterium]
MSARRWWNEPTQTASREALDEIHLRRIRHLVAWAYEHSPMYRRLYDAAGVKPADIVTWDDYYNRLPITDKSDYLADQEGSLSRYGGLALPPETFQQHFHTTGTTGRHLYEVFTQFEMQKSATQYCYSFWDHDIRPGDSVYFCFNWGMWIGLWSIYWGARNMNLLVLSGGGLSSLDRVRQILEYRPKVVIGTATYLLHLVDIAGENGLDLRGAGVKVIGGGGEPGYSIPMTRQRLIDAWGGPAVIDMYGIGETMHVAQSCREWGGGVHVIEDVCHGYSADPETGRPIFDDGAVGENIVTSYTHFAQPFIKYRTHDLVRRNYHPDHGCGWTWAHLPGVVLGRSDFMVTIRGTNVYPTAVENLLGGVSGLSTHYELHISRRGGMDQMLVRVEAAAGLAEGEANEVARRLAEHLRGSLGVRVDTEVVAPTSLPRYELKTKRIFDHRTADERPQFDLGRMTP